jgi:UDP:flavonoid glycosyltransferase YjiC (YdhE family)
VRVLFIPWGQATHYFYQVPLAWAFRADGDEVRVAAQPGAADAVKRSGMSVMVVGEGYDFMPELAAFSEESRRDMARLQATVSSGFARYAPQNGNGTPAPADEGRRGEIAAKRKMAIQSKLAPFTRAAQVMADEVVELARTWQPELVVSDPMVLAAPLAARAAGAPLVHVQWGPAVHRMTGMFPGSGASPALWPDDLRDLYARHGTEPAAEHAAATVDSCPASLQYAGVIPGRVPVRFIPYNGTGDAPRWLTEPPARPRVCVNWGTTTTALAGPDSFLVPRILDALAAFGTETVVTITAADRPLLGGDLPAHVRVAENLPLHLLLPSCDAIIHHGGSGTMLTAASSGLPQLLISPGIMDNMANGERIAAAGAGAALNHADASHETITAGIKTILSDQATRHAARTLRDEIHAQPAPADITTTLRHLTPGHHTTTRQPAP